MESGFIDPLLRLFAERFPDFHIQAYADDTSFLAPLRNLHDFEKLVQPAIDFVDDWVKSAGLDFNIAKTQVTVFRYAQGNLRQNNIYYQPILRLRGQLLAITDEVKYLGVTLSSDMKFSEHVHNISRSARQMLGALRRKFTRFISPAIIEKVYSACIRARLDYGCMAWDPILKGDIEDLERAQFLALRFFLKDWNIPYNEALSKAGWESLYARRQKLKLCQFFKFYRGIHDHHFQFVHSVDTGRRISARSNLPPHHLEQRKHNSMSYEQCFLFSSIDHWNRLSTETVSGSFFHFKRLLGDVTFSH